MSAADRAGMHAGIHVDHRKEFSQACKWSAITCVVSPLTHRHALQACLHISGGHAFGFLCGQAASSAWASDLHHFPPCSSCENLHSRPTQLLPVYTPPHLDTP